MTAEAEEEAEEASLSEPDCSPSAPLSPWDGRAGVRGPGGLRSGRGSAPALIGAAACERPAEQATARRHSRATRAPRPPPHRALGRGGVRTCGARVGDARHAFGSLRLRLRDQPQQVRAPLVARNRASKVAPPCAFGRASRRSRTVTALGTNLNRKKEVY